MSREAIDNIAEEMITIMEIEGKIDLSEDNSMTGGNTIEMKVDKEEDKTDLETRTDQEIMKTMTQGLSSLRRSLTSRP